MTTANLTPQAWEGLLCGLLEQSDPIRSRWLQEHPQRTQIVRQLVIEASEMLDRVNDPSAMSNPAFWSSISPQDRPAEVAAIMIESVELWDETSQAWPNPTPPTEPPQREPLPEAIPGSAPIRRGWVPPG